MKQFLGEDNMRKEKMLEKKLHLQSLVKKLKSKLNSMGGVQSDMVAIYQLSKCTLLIQQLIQPYSTRVLSKVVMSW